MEQCISIYSFITFLFVNANFGLVVNNSSPPVSTIANAKWTPPKLLGILSLPFPSYVEVIQDHPNEPEIVDQYTLFLSTFNPINFNFDPKYYLRSPGKYFNETPESDWALIELDRNAYWLNSPEPLPTGVFTDPDLQGIVWTSGFLVPGKKRGKLQVYDTTGPSIVGPINLAGQDATDWSYHRVIWKDIDLDGDLDALVPRFHVPLIGATQKSLAWFENPGLSFNETSPLGWTQRELISNGPDVHIQNLQINGFDVIVSANFWNEAVVLYYTSNGNWSDVESINQIIIDDSPDMGRTFDIYVDDFNLDGKQDILVTAFNHTYGNVWLWELPDNIEQFPNVTKDDFKRHLIASGFVPNDVIGGESMTPGSPKSFWPSEEYKWDENGNLRRPYIMLSGDDDGKHYVLTPENEDSSNWSYTTNVLVDTAGATSGKFSIVDLDGDGFTEIIVCGYTADKIYVFTFGETG